MKNLSILLTVVGIGLLSAGVVHAEHRGGPKGGGPKGGGGRVAARPFVQGVNPNFAATVGLGPRGVIGGTRFGSGAFGAGGFGGGGFVGNFGFAGGGFGSAYGYGFSENTLLYRLNYIPVPPYFALHPPVYYGQRLFRTYGDSPFADYPYPRAYRQPAAAQMITNPTFPLVPVSSRKPTADLTASSQAASSHGQWIVNPFYDGAEQLAASE